MEEYDKQHYKIICRNKTTIIMIKTTISEAIKIKQQILTDDKLLNSIQITIDLITKCYKNQNKILLCGNGGSAADAQHIASELSGRFYLDRPSLPAEAMHVNTSYLTAVANDYSFEDVYARYLQGIGKKGDVLIGLSTSGNSENILRAMKQAKNLGLNTVLFTGKTGGKIMQYSDISINVPSENTPRIQEMHILIGHIICENVENNLFGKKEIPAS